MFLIEEILFYYFLTAVLYTFTLSVAAKLSKPKRYPAGGKLNRIALFVPCYKEDEVIVHVAENLLGIDYPMDLYDVVIIADSLQPATVEKLRQLPIIVVPVSFDKSTKTKSLNVAFDTLTKPYDIAVVNDADNVVKSAFLHDINNAFNAGNRVVQAQRVAKNLNTSFAVLDAASEMINNHLFRKGPVALGLSSSIIGSGMAYEFGLLKDELKKIDAVGGFDKVLQLAVLEKGIKIQYLEGTLVFDEKIQSSEAFKNQRRRWVSSQLIYARQYFLKGIAALFKGKLDYFHQAMLYNIFPPRILMLFFLFALPIAVTILFAGHWAIITKWYTLLVAYLTALALGIPSSFYNRRLLAAVFQIPAAIFRMAQALFNVRKANQRFIHTKHTSVGVDHDSFTQK